MLLSFSSQYCGNCHHQNPAVEQQAPTPDVTKIQDHAGFKRGICSRCDLPQAREARLDVKPSMMPRTIPLDVVEWMGPRPHQTHVAFQNVPKLRQFVETVLAKKPAEACNARIISDFEEGAAALVQAAQIVFQLVRTRHHRPKFVAYESAPFFSDAERRVNDRPG